MNLPEIKVSVQDSKKLVYLPNHLHYILFEILKNSVEATIKNNSLKPVKVKCIHNKNGVNISITDYGGGFKFEDREKVFSFLYTTNNYRDDIMNNIIPVSGFGFGLGMSKLYVEYFGGQIHIMPLENHGTTVFINMNSLVNNGKYIADLKY